MIKIFYSLFFLTCWGQEDPERTKKLWELHNLFDQLNG